MPKSILRTRRIPEILESTAQNTPNGDAAENFAASNLLSAIGGEISWGSRNEDGNKIDLICSFSHPWMGESIILLIQVKSGSAFGESLSTGFKLKSAAKNAALRTTHSICLIWVDRSLHKCYWSLIYPNTSRSGQTYGRNHIVDPCLRFDIARIQSNHLPTKCGGKGITIKKTNKLLTDSRKEAFIAYKAASISPPISPNLGKIEFTRIGWRHMFRITRKKLYKSKSIDVIPYLSQILKDRASSTYTSSINYLDLPGDFDYRISEYVLVFDDVKISDKAAGTNLNISVVVRVKEEIRWPKTWRSFSILYQRIERRVVIISANYK